MFHWISGSSANWQLVFNARMCCPPGLKECWSETELVKTCLRAPLAVLFFLIPNQGNRKKASACGVDRVKRVASPQMCNHIDLDWLLLSFHRFIEVSRQSTHTTTTLNLQFFYWNNEVPYKWVPTFSVNIELCLLIYFIYPNKQFCLLSLKVNLLLRK